ncbi:hypothetical protein [Tolypothrix sp. NIES-4075]|uniref:hypothetical protein n=1 Tax=Tolypothrix sp. NIES-4075 TaxID=2005459 RepID=UPI00117BF15C|nr:hypothetical protein [Tolypothrix sp. NIES-4075]
MSAILGLRFVSVGVNCFDPGCRYPRRIRSLDFRDFLTRVSRQALPDAKGKCDRLTLRSLNRRSLNF